MVTILFPDRESERRALAFLVARFRARVLRPGKHWIPREVLDELARLNIPFRVQPNAQQRVAAVRGAAAAPIQ
jgi:hypothetical protein